MPRFIFTADIHTRAKRPRCRIDGGKLIGDIKADEAWQSFQRSCLSQLASIANEKGCQLVVDGDIFDKPVVPECIKNDVITEFSRVTKGTRILAGNHDLPGHNFENLKDSSIGVLFAMFDQESKIKGMGGIGCYQHFGSEIKTSNKNPDLLFIHRLVFEKQVPPFIEAITAKELLEEYPDKKWIFTGDMHKAFHYEKNGRHVVNAGCVNRQDANEIEYKPSVWYIDTDKEIVERIYLKDDSEMVEDSYLTNEKERNEKLSAFAELIKNKRNNKFSLSFDKNIENALLENKKTLGKDVVVEVVELMEGVV